MLTDMYYPIVHIRHNLEIYIQKWGLKSLVLGVSGGIDSALCAVLARPVCDKLKIPLIGRSISIETNKPDEKERACELGKIICTDFEDSDFSDEYSYLLQSKAQRDPSILQNTIPAKIRRGNLKARMRMIELYDIAGATKGLVLSTDNYTELLLGFWTLHGDVGDFGLIQKVWKTEVYRMSEFLVDTMNRGNKAILLTSKKELDYPYPLLNMDLDNLAYWLQKTIDAIPTDGLGITSSDLDQIMPDWTKKFKSYREAYEEVDKLLDEFMNVGLMSLADNPVIQRHRKAKAKRGNPFNVPRSVVVSGTGLTAEVDINDKEYPQLYT